MAKTKISEFSATPANNTDIDSINLAEGCAPSGINDAIRELMAQLKDFQTGAAGDSFNGPVGTTTAAAGAFTNLTASGTLGVTGVATLATGSILNTPASVNLTNATALPVTTGIAGMGSGVSTFLAIPSSANLAAAITDETGTGALVFANSPTLVTPALGTPASGVVTNLTGTASININGTVGATTASTVAATTLTTSSTVTHNGGTANGVTYLNGSKVLTSGSALTFDGTKLSTPVSGSISADFGGIQLGGNGTDISGTVAGLAFKAVGANPIQFSINGSEAMRLTSTGLGIGTSSPSYPLDVVASQVRASSASSLGVRMSFNSTSTNGRNWQIGSNFSVGNGEFAIYDATASANRLVIDSSGNLLVGTTSAGAMITAKTQTASGSALATLGTSGDTPFQAVLVTKFDNDSTTSQNFIQFQINNGGANCGKIVANGANTAAFASTSDARAKENITDLPSQLGNILALRPVEFDYIPALGGGHQVGFIAQEMQQVFPDAVSGDGTEENILAITGWSKTEARLVKAIQDQQAIITALTARVAALEVA